MNCCMRVGGVLLLSKVPTALRCCRHSPTLAVCRTPRATFFKSELSISA